MEKIVVQKIVKVNSDVTQMYFRVVSAINDLQLTDRDISLLSFVANKGNISDKSLRMEFCVENNTTPDSINNIVSKLKRIGILIKQERVIGLSPIFRFDYSKDIQLQIDLKHEK